MIHDQDGDLRDDVYDDTEECWQCFGEGGWASCAEDCCPMDGGEECCTDPACWNKCAVCRGCGYIHVGPIRGSDDA